MHLFVGKCQLHNVRIMYFLLIEVSVTKKFDPSHEKTNVMISALCINPDQPAQSTQANPGRHILSLGDRVMIPETENLQEAKRVYLGKPARHA